MIKDVNLLVKEMIKNPSVSNEEVFTFVKEKCPPSSLKPVTLGMLLEIYAGISYDPDDPTSCFSREISIEELKQIHPDFESKNGCQWARSDNSYLGKKYKIKRPKKNGKVVAIQLDGPNNNSLKKYRGIRPDIRKEISKQSCAILDVHSNIEVDHKNGRYDELSNISPEEQKLSSFQALSKSANNAKRQHCKNCKQTKRRYDARNLGYKEGWTVGDEYTDSCGGCYWYDPFQFNKMISEDFKKIR